MEKTEREWLDDLLMIADQFRAHCEWLEDRLAFLAEFGLSEGNAERLGRYARAAVECEAMGRGAVLLSGTLAWVRSLEGRRELEMRGLELAFWAGRYGRLCERVLRCAPRVRSGGASPFLEGGDDDGSSL